MKAENTKSKIRKIYNQETSNEQTISNLEGEITNTTNSVKNTEYVNNFKNKIHDLSTDWLDMDIFSAEQWVENTYETAMYKEIRINLPDTPIKFLPFIDVQTLYKSPDWVSSLFFISTEDFYINARDNRLRKGYFFEVRKIENNIAKNVTLIIGVSVVKTQYVHYEIFPIQIKVLISLSNMESYL